MCTAHGVSGDGRLLERTLPKDPKTSENYRIGHLLGATDNQIPFTVNIEKLLHYHLGAFAFTGSGKSNLTSLIVRKAMNSVSNVKFVIFDISSEYGVNILAHSM
jgi:DNA helicase HerA-like ATPase